MKKYFYRLCSLSIVAALLSSCVYRPLVDFEDISFWRANEVQDHQPLDLSSYRDDPSARGRFFLPATPKVMLPPPSLSITPEVKRELRLYKQGNYRAVRMAHKRRAEFYPMLVEVFKDEGVPIEMLNLAFIESGFRPSARSRAGAVGMWQFMKSTARVYGLKVGIFQDERKDPILSTIAAARHLRDLYYSYKDWYLVLAAYNAGTGRVDRAIRRSGSRDYWTLCRKRQLPAQTRRFVPRFIAATIIEKELAQDE